MPLEQDVYVVIIYKHKPLLGLEPHLYPHETVITLVQKKKKNKKKKNSIGNYNSQNSARGSSDSSARLALDVELLLQHSSPDSGSGKPSIRRENRGLKRRGNTAWRFFLTVSLRTGCFRMGNGINKVRLSSVACDCSSAGLTHTSGSRWFYEWTWGGDTHLSSSVETLGCAAKSPPNITEHKPSTTLSVLPINIVVIFIPHAWSEV